MTTTTDNDTAVLHVLCRPEYTTGGASGTRLAEELGAKPLPVRTHLQQLLAAGLVEKQGEGAGTRWLATPAGAAAAAATEPPAPAAPPRRKRAKAAPKAEPWDVLWEDGTRMLLERGGRLWVAQRVT